MFFPLGLLIVAARLRSGRIADSVLGNVAEWVMAQESLQRHAFEWNPADPPPTAFSLQYGYWQPLAEELKSKAASIPADNVRLNLQLCACSLRRTKACDISRAGCQWWYAPPVSSSYLAGALVEYDQGLSDMLTSATRTVP